MYAIECSACAGANDGTNGAMLGATLGASDGANKGGNDGVNEGQLEISLGFVCHYFAHIFIVSVGALSVFVGSHLVTMKGWSDDTSKVQSKKKCFL